MECHKWKSRRMLEKQIRRQQQRRRKKIELQKHKKKLKKNKTEKKIPLSIVCRCNTKILSVKLVAASLRYYSTFYSIQPFAFRNFVLVSVLCAWARFLWPTLLLLGIQVILNYLFFCCSVFLPFYSVAQFQAICHSEYLPYYYDYWSDDCSWSIARLRAKNSYFLVPLSVSVSHLLYTLHNAHRYEGFFPFIFSFHMLLYFFFVHLFSF